jgi:hypothetical protein
MERQISVERARIQETEMARERELKKNMESLVGDLEAKERYLAESVERQLALERRLGELNSAESEQKAENERLARANAQLEEQLMESVRSLEDSKSYISELRSRGEAERRARASSAWQRSEGVVVERAGLERELEELRNVNKRLQDERDELELIVSFLGIFTLWKSFKKKKVF